MVVNTDIEKNRADYTEGSILRSILKMGLPSMFGFLIHHIYILTDIYWVSRLSSMESGVAAITFVGNILWVIFSFNQLVGPGSVAIISRRYGEKSYDLAEKAIKETLILKLVFGSIFGIVGYFLIGKGIQLIGGSGEALYMGINYGKIMFLGLPVMFASYSIFTALRGVANPHLAFILMLSSSVLNMILDPLLMFGYLGLPKLGINGAAIASLISYAIVFIAGILIFYTGKANVGLHLRGREPISLRTMWKIVKIGLPAWLGDFSLSASRMLITRFVAPFGITVVAAYGVSNQIVGFGVMMLVGIGLGLSSLIGHNIGSNKLERAKMTANQAVILGTSMMTALGIIVYFLCPQIMSLFFENSETIKSGVQILKIVTISFPFFGAFIMMETIHMGVGLNTPVMVIGMIQAWVFTVLPVYILTTLFEINQQAIWWILSLSIVTACTLFYFYYRKGRWLTHQL